jgi:hypothetical protein
MDARAGTGRTSESRKEPIFILYGTYLIHLDKSYENAYLILLENSSAIFQVT